MKAFTAILHAFLISLAVTGCTNRAPSLRMLDSRADYDDPNDQRGPMLNEGGLEGYEQSPVPVRSRARVAACFIHPHEMASHDYFWGGWISLVVEQDQWVLERPKAMPKAPLLKSTSVKPAPVKKTSTHRHHETEGKS